MVGERAHGLCHAQNGFRIVGQAAAQCQIPSQKKLGEDQCANEAIQLQPVAEPMRLV